MNALDFLHQIFKNVPGLVRISSHYDNDERKCDKCRYKPIAEVDRIDYLQTTSRHVLFTPVTRNDRKGTKDASYATRVLWLDLDNSGRPDFPDTFIPTFTVMSGHGYHFYWLLDKPVTVLPGSKSHDWLELTLKAIAKRFNGDMSPTHTAANMRLPGSYNIKGGDCIEVTCEKTGPVYSSSLIETIGKHEEEKNRVAAPAPKPSTPPQRHEHADADLMLENCNFMQHAGRSPGDISEPAWFDLLRTCAALPGGDSIAHYLSSGHPEYKHSTCEAKLRHAKKYDPASCDRFEGEGCCGNCSWRGEVKSPAGIPYKLLGQKKAA